MEERKGNILLAGILIILMIVAIAIVIVNPNKIENIVETSEDTNNQTNRNNEILKKENEQEEKTVSMEQGGTFCKVENQIVFFEEANKSVYLYNIENNESKKIATIDYTLNKIYFDGNNIYLLPNYYSKKGIYKCNLEGEISKIYDGSSLQLHITDNEIYFVNQIGYDDFNKNPQGTLCVMTKEGTEVRELAKNVKNYFFVGNGKIYFTTQDRRLNSIDMTGENLVNLAQGRKFTTHLSEKYLLYVDYANQEAEHIINLETNEDKVIGYYATVKEYQGKTYINIRKRLDDGSIEAMYTLFELKEDGTISEIPNKSITETFRVSENQTEFKYITSDKAYLYTYKEIYKGLGVIKLEGGEILDEEKYSDCKYFLGGYGYKIDNSDLENIKIERVEL